MSELRDRVIAYNAEGAARGIASARADGRGRAWVRVWGIKEAI